jgi:hypothetical protein
MVPRRTLVGLPFAKNPFVNSRAPARRKQPTGWRLFAASTYQLLLAKAFGTMARNSARRVLDKILYFTCFYPFVFVCQAGAFLVARSEEKSMIRTV